MRAVIIISLILLPGCIAIPRGEHYVPEHPLGESHSVTCDRGGNKVGLNIPLEDGASLLASLTPSDDGEHWLSVTLALPDGVEVTLSSNTLQVEDASGKIKNMQVESWKALRLKGTKVAVQVGNIKYYSDKFFSATLKIHGEPSVLRVVLPKITSGKREVQPNTIIFKKHTGGVQWHPALNC